MSSRSVLGPLVTFLHGAATTSCRRDEADAELERGLYPTEVAIRTRGGARDAGAEKVPLGGPERPLTAADPGRTFVALAEPVLGPAAAREAWRAGQALPSAGGVRA